MLHFIRETTAKRIGQRLRFAALLFVRPGLPDKRHQKISVEQRVHHAVQRRDPGRKAGMLFKAGHAERNDRDITVSGALKRLAQKENIVGRAAPAPGLKINQRDAVRIVFAALNGMDKLADDQYRGITGVVMYVFQPGFDNLGSGGFQ